MIWSTALEGGREVGTTTIWLAVGFLGQVLFSARFIIQWLASEQAGKSVMPLAFWYLSLGGGLILLAYAIYRRDPVFILGQAFGALIYLRNLYFVHRDRIDAEVEKEVHERI